MSYLGRIESQGKLEHYGKGKTRVNNFSATDEIKITYRDSILLFQELP